MKTKFVWLIVSCLMVAALVLASCAPAVVEEKEVKGVVEEGEKKVEEVEEVEEKVDPQYGGIVNLMQGDKMISWDINDLMAGSGYNRHGVYDLLMVMDWWKDPERKIVEMNFNNDYQTAERIWTGALAESWEQPDPLTIIFHLRKGVRFHNKPPVNGREFVADDVVWAFERLLTNPGLQGAAQQNIESMETPDKYTVVFHLEKPDIGMLMAIGFPTQFAMAPHEVVDLYGNLRDWRYQIGTGPFMVDDYVPDSSITYKRNPDWWQKDPQGRSLPYVDGAKLLYIPDASTQVAALRTGKIDFNGEIDTIGLDQKPSLEATSPHLQFAPTYSGHWLMYMKTTIEPFNKLEVRQALIMATNHEEINDTLFGGTAVSYAFPGDPRLTDVFTPLDELPEHLRETYGTYNPTKAKEMLAEAGYPNGFNISLQYYAVGARYEVMGDAVQLLKEQWKEAGVELDLVPIDLATMGTFKKTKAYDHIFGTCTGRGEPVKVARDRWYTDGKFNRALVSDPIIDDYIDQASVVFDYTERMAILKELYLYMTEQAHHIAMPMIARYNCWQPWIKGYKGETGVVDHGLMTVAARIWLDLDLKEELVGRR